MLKNFKYLFLKLKAYIFELMANNCDRIYSFRLHQLVLWKSDVLEILSIFVMRHGQGP